MEWGGVGVGWDRDEKGWVNGVAWDALGWGEEGGMGCGGVGGVWVGTGWDGMGSDSLPVDGLDGWNGMVYGGVG